VLESVTNHEQVYDKIFSKKLGINTYTVLHSGWSWAVFAVTQGSKCDLPALPWTGRNHTVTSFPRTIMPACPHEIW